MFSVWFFLIKHWEFIFKLDTPNDHNFCFAFHLGFTGEVLETLLSHKSGVIFKVEVFFLWFGLVWVFSSSGQDGRWAQRTGSLHHVISERNSTRGEWWAWNYNLREREKKTLNTEPDLKMLLGEGTGMVQTRLTGNWSFYPKRTFLSVLAQEKLTFFLIS